MSKAGANFGLDLLWAILLSCLITYYLIVQFSRFTMASGITIIQGIKNHIHPGVAITLVVAFMIIIISALIGVLGIVADVLQVWSQTVSEVNISAGIFAAVVGFALYLLIWWGNYVIFEKALAILVTVMGIAFISTMLINFPSLKTLFNGLIPTIPETAEGSDNSSLVIVSGMVGTTISVFVFVIRTQMVKETGWTMADRKIQRRDALVSASMMFLISVAVMITAATTLHENGLSMNHVVEMIPLMEPIAGKAALLVFVVGIVSAGLSSHLPNLLVIPWLFNDYKNIKPDTQSTTNRIVILVLTVCSIGGVMLGFKSIFVMMLSQACAAVVLPVTIISLLYLSNKKSLMNGYKNILCNNVLLSLVLAFSLYMSSLGIRGIITDLSNL